MDQFTGTSGSDSRPSVDGPGAAASALAYTNRSDRAGEPDQLQLRFFAIIDGFMRRPPERALWRVLIDTALAKTKVFTVRDRPISAEAVHHVALALYMQADAAGVIHEFSAECLAEQCRLNERSVRAARQVLNDLRVVRSIPGRGRKPAVHRLNLGGLDWPAVRRRAGSPRPGMVPGQSGPEGGPRGGTMPGQDGRRPGMVPGPMGYTIGLPLSAVADVRGTSEDNAGADRQQQQRKEQRVEGLIAAIAARARRLGMKYDEADERRRLAAGGIGLDELQALADRLGDELGDRLRRRRR